MTETKATNLTDFWKRLVKALPWFLAGMVAFGLLGFGGASYMDNRETWPLQQAEVVATRIHWAQHMSDQYELIIDLRVHPKNGAVYQASLLQGGPKGALEKRAQGRYAIGKWVSVCSDPSHTGRVVLPQSNAWGAWLIAIIVGMFFFGNGLTVLNRSAQKTLP